LLKNVLWIKIENGVASEELLRTDDVQVLPSGSVCQDHGTIFCNNISEPIYPNDSTAHAWVLNGGDSEFQENKESTLMKPDFRAPSTNPEIWDGPSKFCFEFTSDFDQVGFGRGKKEEAKSGKMASFLHFVEDFVKGKLSLKEYLLFCSILGLLFSFSYFAASLLQTNPNDTLTAQELHSIVEQNTEEKVTLRALRLGKPEAMRRLENVVSNKLARKPERYVESLIALEKVRAQYPAETLPSRRFVAALGLIQNNETNLDKVAEWAQLLRSLGPERNDILVILAYEASKAQRRVQQKWSVTRGRGPLSTTQEWIVGNKTTSPKERNRNLKDFEDTAKGLGRVMAAWNQKTGAKSNFEQRLLARLMYHFLQLSWHIDAAAQKTYFLSVLRSLENDSTKLLDRDRKLLVYLIKEREQDLNSAQDISLVLQRRFTNLTEDNLPSLCQLQSSAFGSEHVLFSLLIAAYRNIAPMQMQLPALNIWDRCFVGASPFLTFESQSFAEANEVDPFVYVPGRSPLEGQLSLALDKAWRSLPNSSNKDSFQNWIRMILLNDVVPAARASLIKSEVQMCQNSSKVTTKKEKSESFCQQLLFYAESNPAKRMEFVRSQQEDWPFATLSHLAFRVALDYYSDAPWSMSRQEAIAAFDRFGFGQYFGESYAEFPVLEWYLKALPEQPMGGKLGR
jgi:hypothetical protein